MTKAQDTVQRPAQAGFNLIEMIFVLGFMGVLSAMAVIQMNVSRPGLKGDGAMRVILGQMNQAREMAITQRRYMQVVFTAPNLVQIIREDTTTTTTTLSGVLLEGGVEFVLVTGVPGSTELFSSNPPTAANGFGTVKFSPSGTLVSQDGAEKDGSLFLALPGQALSARAVTVQGSTGRVRGYKWDGRHWNVV